MTDNPKAENDNRSGESVKPAPCLHCAIVDTLNTWSATHRDGKLMPREGFDALIQCVSEMLRQAPMEDRADVTMGVCAVIARQAGVAAHFDVEPDDTAPAAHRTKH